MKMPFGKHKGKELSELTPNYILWLQYNIPLKEPLKSAIDKRMKDSDILHKLDQIKMLDAYYDSFNWGEPEYY